MDRRALLTDREREVLRGEANDVENLPQYQSKVRSRVRQRIERLREDFELLEELEPELHNAIDSALCDSAANRLDQLEDEVDKLKSRIDSGE